MILRAIFQVMIFSRILTVLHLKLFSGACTLEEESSAELCYSTKEIHYNKLYRYINSRSTVLFLSKYIARLGFALVRKI